MPIFEYDENDEALKSKSAYILNCHHTLQRRLYGLKQQIANLTKLSG